MLAKLMATGLVAAALVYGQRAGGGGRGNQPGMDIQMPRMTSKLEMMGDRLKLSKDQKKQIKAIMDEGQKEAAPHRDGLAKDRLAIASGVQAGKTPEDLKPLVQSYGEHVAHMTELELKAYTKVVGTLDEEQKPRAQFLLQMMTGVFKNKNWDTD